MEANLDAQGLNGSKGALAQMAGRVTEQATVMSFVDVFVLLTMVFAGLAVMALLMKPPPKGTKAPAH